MINSAIWQILARFIYPHERYRIEHDFVWYQVSPSVTHYLGISLQDFESAVAGIDARQRHFGPQWRNHHCAALTQHYQRFQRPCFFRVVSYILHTYRTHTLAVASRSRACNTTDYARTSESAHEVTWGSSDILDPRRPRCRRKSEDKMI